MRHWKKSKIILILILMIILLAIVAADGWLRGALAHFKPALNIAAISNEYVLIWDKLPYPVYYEVEVLNHPPADDRQPAGPTERIARYRTWENKFVIDQKFPFRTYWRVTARSLLRLPVGRYSEAINLAEVADVTAVSFHAVKPVATSHYPHHDPAPARPFLTWTTVPGAVYYEIELLSAPPENPGDILPSRHRFFASQEVFTNGYQADLSAYGGDHLYWRVRALDYNGHPLGVFSDAAEIFIDRSLPQLLKPLINADLNRDGMPTPLYPVYSWIPISGATHYEVEVTDQPPENPNGIAPSRHRIWSKRVASIDCYDEEPRIRPGTYYWRVRGLDAAGNPVGVFSNAAPYVVDLSKGNYAATFGDSITHGGGAISYSPADWEYSFQTYLNFPVVNLGRSGDTSATMAARFESDVLPFQPKYLIILGGTNSLRGGTPASEVIKDLTAIRDKCLKYGIRPIFLTLPPINPAAIDRAFNEETVPNWREEFDAVNRFIRQQRYYIDLDPFFCDAARELPDHYAIDGLHPDIEGKKLMAQIINANWARVTR